MKFATTIMALALALTTSAQPIELLFDCAVSTEWGECCASFTAEGEGVDCTFTPQYRINIYIGNANAMQARLPHSQIRPPPTSVASRHQASLLAATDQLSWYIFLFPWTLQLLTSQNKVLGAHQLICDQSEVIYT
jgi:hypothetical protein